MNLPGGDSRWCPPTLELEDRELISSAAEAFVTALAFVFLGLLVVELAIPLGATWSRRLQLAGWIIWAIFLVDFVVRFAVASSKVAYLRANWLTALAVALPAFRVFRVARAMRVARGLRVARVVTGGNRGMRALRRVAGAGGIGYVVALTLLVLFLAAAGIYSLERGHPETRITSFSESLWWSATIITTLGSEFYPRTTEGRILGVIVMIYGLAVSGYVTAILAVFLLGKRDEEAPPSELRALREDVRRLVAELERQRGAGDQGATDAARTSEPPSGSP